MRTRSLLFLAPILLSACGSIGLGDILGNPGSGGSTYGSDIRGEVVRVDTVARRIDLNANAANNLNDQRGNSSIRYDDNTVVEFNGNTYRPEDLERGDQISVLGSRQGDSFIADRIVVERNVRDAGGYRPEDDRLAEVRGTVRLIDTRDRLVELDLAYGERGENLFYYDDRTVVEYNGRQYNVESLERGDEVSVRGERRGDRFLADTVQVLRNSAERR